MLPVLHYPPCDMRVKIYLPLALVNRSMGLCLFMNTFLQELKLVHHDIIEKDVQKSSEQTTVSVHIYKYLHK